MWTRGLREPRSPKKSVIISDVAYTDGNVEVQNEIKIYFTAVIVFFLFFSLITSITPPQAPPPPGPSTPSVSATSDYVTEFKGSRKKSSFF